MVSAVVALVLFAAVAVGGYALGRHNERSSQDDVISDCKDVIATLQLALQAANRPEDNVSTSYGVADDNRCDVELSQD